MRNRICRALIGVKWIGSEGAQKLSFQNGLILRSVPSRKAK
jgi:hypothetical protein